MKGAFAPIVFLVVVSLAGAAAVAGPFPLESSGQIVAGGAIWWVILCRSSVGSPTRKAIGVPARERLAVHATLIDAHARIELELRDNRTSLLQAEQWMQHREMALFFLQDDAGGRDEHSRCRSIYLHHAYHGQEFQHATPRASLRRSPG